MAVRPDNYPTVNHKGDIWCFHQDDLWIWDPTVQPDGIWEAVEPWPPEFSVTESGKLQLNGQDVKDLTHKCYCDIQVLLSRGCICDGV